MTIWAPKLQGHACTKIPYKGYEISIAMGDSCGAFAEYSRSSIAVFHTTQGKHCVSHLFFDGAVECDATAENLIAIFKKIDELETPVTTGFNHDVARVPGQTLKHTLMRHSEKSLCGMVDRVQGLSYVGAWDSGERATCNECKRLWKNFRAKAKRERST